MVLTGKSNLLIKYLLFFFNFVFVATGLALIIVGAIVEYKARNYLNVLGDKYVSTAVLLIILGVVVFLIAFFGCCGAVKENHCMITTFSIFLFILFIMELAGGIAAYVYRDNLQDIAQEGLNNTFTKAFQDQDKDAIKGWEDIQTEFNCCGLNGPEDYQNNPNDTMFRTCCKDLELSEMCSETSSKLRKQPCKTKVIDFFKDKIGMVGGAGIGIAFIEVVGIVFACCLIRAIKKEYEVV